jgi:hypothetical protein
LKWVHRGGAQPHCQRKEGLEMTEGEKLTEREGEDEPKPQEIAGARPETVDADGEVESPRTEKNWRLAEKKKPLARSGWGRIFKTRDGHTGQSTVPVRCTPDSAQ